VSSPINMHHSVLQSVISERVQQVQQQHPDRQQRYFEYELTQERLKNEHKVNDSDEMDYIKLRDKEKRKEHKNQQKGRDDEKQALEPETAVRSDHAGKIDIKA
jgi:hypothetical protein